MICEACGYSNNPNRRTCKQCRQPLDETLAPPRAPDPYRAAPATDTFAMASYPSPGVPERTPGGRFAEYSVVTVQPGCCASNVEPSDLNKHCNRMASNGYQLVTAYESIVGCAFCQTKAAVLIFGR